MAKWEYKVLFVHSTNQGLDINLVELGADGWELVSAVPKTTSLSLPELAMKPAFGSTKFVAEKSSILSSTELICVFKRPLS